MVSANYCNGGAGLTLEQVCDRQRGRTVHLSQADLHQANLIGANLTGADLATAVNLGNANLTEARYDDATRWPGGFTPPPEAIKFNE